MASSHHDLIRRCYQPLQQWYILQPVADGCSLLLRYMASGEQLLPPRGQRIMLSILVRPCCWLMFSWKLQEAAPLQQVPASFAADSCEGYSGIMGQGPPVEAKVHSDQDRHKVRHATTNTIELTQIMYPQEQLWLQL